MRPRNPRREFAFVLNDVARLLRTYADQRARRLGITRAQWAVMARLEHAEGLKQSELADLLDLQPITLTRLVDRLCANGLRVYPSNIKTREALARENLAVAIANSSNVHVFQLERIAARLVETQWLEAWLADAVVASLIAAVTMYRKAKRAGVTLMSAAGRRFFISYFAPIA